MPVDDPRDDLVTIAALAEFHNRHADADPARANRALELAATLASTHGLTVADAVRQSRPPKHVGDRDTPDRRRRTR